MRIGLLGAGHVQSEYEFFGVSTSGGKEVSRPLWWLTRDGDRACLELYRRHYSSRKYKDGRKPKLFCGPGEKVVLRTLEGDAFFVWKKFKDASGQEGVNCSVFRNESTHLSSELIQQADAIAFCVWPDCRHYTYVNAKRIKSSNAGFCFLKAGWRRLEQQTKSGLVILEKLK